MIRRGRPGDTRGTARAVLAAVLASAALLTGCAQSVDPIERLGKRAAVGARPTPTPPDRAYRRWGLAAPLAAPPRHPVRLPGRLPDPSPPDHPGAAPDRPRGSAAGGVPLRVVDRVRTTDRVVFLTYDDGAERDPRFTGLVRDLRLPVTFFLTDSAVGPGYGHFARLRAAGAGIGNHTLHHPALPGLPYRGQRAEICGQQDRLRARLGVRPRLFRPPYGRYDATTLRAAADCALSALVLHRAALTTGGLSFAHGPRRLRPGDIVLVAADDTAAPTLAHRTVRLLRRVQRARLTVAHLEEYL